MIKWKERAEQHLLVWIFGLLVYQKIVFNYIYIYMLSTRDPPHNKRYTQIESERMERLFHANRNNRKAQVTILISDKLDFKTKAITGDNEDYYTILKGLIQ